MGTTLKHILAVEDDPDIQKVIKLALATVGGFTVTIASSGQEASAALEQGQPDIILLDVMMPGVDGPTTFSHVNRPSIATRRPSSWPPRPRATRFSTCGTSAPSPSSPNPSIR